MSRFFSNVTPEEKQAKIDIPRILSKDELRAQAAMLPYALQALMERYVEHRTGRGKKGQRTKGLASKVYHFPSPERTSNLKTTYNVVQTFPLQAITNSTTVPVYGALYFTASQLDNFSSLASVFDQYRIALVEARFSPQVNTNYVGSGTNDGQYVTVVDLDDSTNLGTFNQGLDYPGAQCTQVIRAHKHTFVPHVAVAAYSGSFTSYANEEAPWLDVGSPSVQHFGLKWVFNTASTYTSSVDIITRVWLQLRNVR